ISRSLPTFLKGRIATLLRSRSPTLVNGLACASPLRPPDFELDGDSAPLLLPVNQRSARVTAPSCLRCFGATGTALSSSPGNESEPNSRMTERRSSAKYEIRG